MAALIAMEPLVCIIFSSIFHFYIYALFFFLKNKIRPTTNIDIHTYVVVENWLFGLSLNGLKTGRNVPLRTQYARIFYI